MNKIGMFVVGAVVGAGLVYLLMKTNPPLIGIERINPKEITAYRASMFR